MVFCSLAIRLVWSRRAAQNVAQAIERCGSTERRARERFSSRRCVGVLEDRKRDEGQSMAGAWKARVDPDDKMEADEDRVQKSP